MRDRAWVGEEQTERDTESEAGSRLWAVSSTESDVGLELTNCEIMPWAEIRCLTDWGTQVTIVRHWIWSRFQALSCQHRALCGVQTHEMWDHDLSQSQMLKKKRKGKEKKERKMGMQAGAATLENSMEVPQKTKNRTTIRPSNCTTRHLSRGYRMCCFKGTHAPPCL